ncbi:MAG: hypothetical protein ACYC0B_05515 [Gemmatimonadaceae bacterium]
MPNDEPSGPRPNAFQDPVPRSSTSRRFARRNWGKLTILALVLIPLLGMSIWAGVALSYSYSSGTRTGYVQKLSLKGWLCKTWEGELAMATAPGVSPEIFEFTIRDDSLAGALTTDMGKGRVSITYDEHRGVPTTCFGDTPYFVKSYRLMIDNGLPPLP